MRKTGIMGGTFNPIHNGHLMIAREALEQFQLEEVIFLPCGIPYMKAGQKIAPGIVRAEMTRLAIEPYPDFTLSTFEIDQHTSTYTYVTLEAFRKANPDTEYYFIMGADSLFHITSWKNPERIFANCVVLAAVRDEKTPAEMEQQIALLKKEYHARIFLLHTDYLPVSSSEIRKKLSEGESVCEELPSRVLSYIQAHHLYENEDR